MSPNRRNGNGDRDRIDELGAYLDRRYRTVTVLLLGMMIVGLGAVLIGGIIIRHQQDDLEAQQMQANLERVRLNHAQEDIQEGRRVSISVICAATSAVIEAGRQVISGGRGTGGSAEFTRNLERLGFPPAAKRRIASKRAADGYAALIGKRISDATGVKGLVLRDGTLDCARLARIAKSP